MRSVGFALFLRELKTRLGGRWWGALWTLGEPLASTALMLGVYGLMRTRHLAGVDTLLFLVTGLLPFALFKSLVLRLMEGIDANQGLFAYRQVRPVDAVLARAGVEVALALAMLALSVAILSWMGHEVLPRKPLELLIASALLISLGLALGLLAAVATSGVMVRTRAVVRLGFFPVYLCSGAIFPVSSLPSAAREILLFNPVLHLLDGLRAAFFGHAYRATPYASLWVPIAWLLACAALSLSLYRLRRDRLQPL